MNEDVLWCLPYDSDSVFRPFLKISFSKYLNNIISNQHFPQYQEATARDLRDPKVWNEKSWRLIQFFEFMNDSFLANSWDDHIIFIEDTTLRSTMGYFRLWIDTERLYLLNFLKLDSIQFQDDRIYMTLWRTLAFLNRLFSEHLFKDFEPAFLNNFIREANAQLQKLAYFCPSDSADIISLIVKLLANLRRRQRILVQNKELITLQKQAGVRVNKESEIIKDVEMRLKNAVDYKRKIDQELRFKTIARSNFVEQVEGNAMKGYYDPIHAINTEYREDYFGTPEEKERRREQVVSGRIESYKTEVKGKQPERPRAIYEQLDELGSLPYSDTNYQLYGQATKVDMDRREKYQKETKKEVESTHHQDREKYYVDERFIVDIENTDSTAGSVTQHDLRKGPRQQLKRNQDENTRVFNLKWPRQANKGRRMSEEQFKDYDNNLLFKSPLEQQLLQMRKNNLDRLKAQHDSKSYTTALLEQMANQIHGEAGNTSFGSDFFVRRIPQYMDLADFKTVNYNKFDFMRKVVSYMAAQKKIRNLIDQKGTQDRFPRYYSDIKQESFNPQLKADKVRYAQGLLKQRPPVVL